MLSFGTVMWFASEFQTGLVHDTGETKETITNQLSQHKPLLDPRRDQRNVNTKAFSGEMSGDNS